MPPPIHYSLRMFTICEGMKWTHLPNAGGLYDQHPAMLDDFRLIFGMRAAHEESERKKEEARAKQKSRRTGASRGRY